MGHLIAYLNDRGQLKVEDDDDWDPQVELDESPWLEKHSDELGVNVEEIMCGKGDAYRPVDKKEYDKNHEAIFGETKKHVCSKFIRDPNGGSVDLCYHCGEPEIGTRR